MNLNQITVPSLDLSKSIPFYQELGLKLIVQLQPHYARFECPVGQATFSLQQVEKRPEGDGIHVYFECEHLDAYVDQLISKGFQFEELPPTNPGCGEKQGSKIRTGTNSFCTTPATTG